MTTVESARGALAGAIRDLVTAVEGEGSAKGWDFRPDGPAAKDWTANEQPPGWGDEPLQDAYRTGALGWYLVVDEALSVADLLESGRTLGLLSASRSLAEPAARCGLLLRTATEPAVRIRHMINERLYALYEDWRFADGVPQLDSSWQTTSPRSSSGSKFNVRTTADRPGWANDASRPRRCSAT